MHLYYENFLFISIFLSLLCGILTTLLEDGRKSRRVTLVMLAVCAVLNGIVFVNTSIRGEYFTYAMGQFPAPWGNEVRSGPIESLLATVFCIVIGMSLLGGGRDLEEDILPGKINLYYIMMDLLTASTFALCYTNDMFTGYVFIEIMTIAACSIVMAKDNGQTIVATIIYLIMSMVGSGVFLFGVAILYSISGHLLMPNIMASVTKMFTAGSFHYPMAVVAGMVLVGLAIKSALFPFHTWLPTAHGSATTSSSAILSGVVLKGYVILLIKVMCRVFTMEQIRQLNVNDILFVLGICAMIYGSVRAVPENHSKKMIAFSSVAQVGYIYVGLGLCSTAGMAAALYQILAHAVTKSLLFISTGGLIQTAGHRKSLHDLRGMARRRPLAGIGFTVGALSMVGLPLLAGFITKITLGQAALELGIPRWEMISCLTAIAISSLLNAWYFIQATIQIWKSEEEDVQDENGPVAVHAVAPDRSFGFAVVSLCVMNVVLGCFAEPLVRLLQHSVALL